MKIAGLSFIGIAIFFMGFLIGLRLGVSEGKQEIRDRLSEDANILLDFQEAGHLDVIETIYADPSADFENLIRLKHFILKEKK